MYLRQVIWILYESKIKSHLPEWPLNLPNKGWKGKVKKLLLLLQQVISSLMEMFIICMVLSHFSTVSPDLENLTTH